MEDDEIGDILVPLYSIIFIIFIIILMFFLHQESISEFNEKGEGLISNDNHHFKVIDFNCANYFLYQPNIFHK